jgi:hypothetical protein
MLATMVAHQNFLRASQTRTSHRDKEGQLLVFGTAATRVSPLAYTTGQT